VAFKAKIASEVYTATAFLPLSRCTQIKTYSWDNAQVILVGNKCDMEDERVISFERGKQLADSLGLEFFETSAKENINVRVSAPVTNLFLRLTASTKKVRVAR
jgi:GTPase SAR1 family protein